VGERTSFGGQQISQRLVALAVMTELHHRLREATKAPHRELDHHPLLMPLVREGLTAQTYGNALLALRGVYAPLEEAVCAPAVAAGFDYRERLKLPAMDRDLADLGRPLLTAVASVSPPRNLGALIGMLYTVEGSTLGAQAICRQLSVGSCRDLPMRYFSGYGANTLANWQAFWTFAEAACPVDQLDHACDSAAATFHLIKHHLDEVQRELMLAARMEVTE
jgi:heme oxygenase